MKVNFFNLNLVFDTTSHGSVFRVVIGSIIVVLLTISHDDGPITQIHDVGSISLVKLRAMSLYLKTNIDEKDTPRSL